MSAKPGKDFHSAYVDGEMPEEFIAEYEQRVAKYPESKEELNRVRKLHEILSEDAKTIEISDEFMEKSFEKLQSRMKFSKNVQLSQESSAKNAFRSARVPVAAAAAAAVAVLIPFGAKKSENSSHTEIAAIPRTEVQPISSGGIKIDGNVSSGQFAIAPVSVASSKAVKFNPMSQRKIQPISNSAVKIDGTISSEQLPEVFSSVSSSSQNQNVQKTIRASSLVSTSSSFRAGMTSVDVFRPDFSSSQPVRISLPEFHEIPIE